LLKEWGAVIHYCDALEHDQLMSYVQVAPHAILIAYAQFLVARSVDLQLLGKVSTPASRVIWSMLARMIENDPSVYWEIQAHNVTGQEVRDELAGFLTSLNELIRTDDKKSFDLTFLKLRDLFAGDLATYQSLADKIAGSHSLGTERPPETAPTPP
jgi:prephenate dehydrogenase